MDATHEKELKNLEERINELSKALAKISDDGGRALKDVIKEIHSPGWTTLAEFNFARVLTDGILNQVRNIDAQIQGFRQSAEKVSVKEMSM